MIVTNIAKSFFNYTRQKQSVIGKLIYCVPVALVVYSGHSYADATITAPLFPIAYPEGLYEIEGVNYPTVQQERIDAANQYHKTYETLLGECSALVEGAYLDDNLTDQQILSNYNLVAECSYEYFGSKPYYIPQLVNDVNLCAERFGANYRMLTESDITGFSDTFYSELNRVLMDASPENTDFAGLYFSLFTFIRGDDGVLKIGNLYADFEGDRVTDIAGDWKNHYEGNQNGGTVVLRCMLTE